VQGVGFRPFAFNLANRLGLIGWIRNNSVGAEIEIQGPADSLKEFVSALRVAPPPLARIDKINIIEEPPAAAVGFAILASAPDPYHFASVPSDSATCDACWREFHDPKNRRFGYAFINCTDCGPRYTIIQDTPYDRPNTTMAAFPMCDQCQGEYADPANRRFHTQPNACARCGPGIALIETQNQSWDFASGERALEITRQARALLRAGHILAMRGLGGFHLVCDAMNEDAVAELRRRKRRSEKPFALMAPSIRHAEAIAVLGESDCELILSRERPIVIVNSNSAVAPSVAPHNATVGIMLPYTPLQHLLFAGPGSQDYEFAALVMTSGNISEEPIVASNAQALDRLQSIADYFLLHNRDIYMRVDDSVARSFSGKPQVMRRSRGYAPVNIKLQGSQIDLLACGAELKNTFCLTKERCTIISQHIGDLENYETLRFFEESLENLKKLFRVQPAAVAYDLHPRYLSTRFALQYPVERRIGVQHHHAHIASCMAESGIRDRVIGVAFDGTGYGTDGKIWGGEFLIAGFTGFKRRAHLRYVPLAGGDTAVRQNWRSALAYLHDAFGRNIPDGLPPLFVPPHKEVEIVSAMLKQNLNVIQTSSCGRLFDAVAALLDIRQEVSFEGQAAIELEQAVGAATNEDYTFDLSGAEPYEIDFRPMITAIVRGTLSGVPTGVIAARFHNTLARCILETCKRLRTSERLNRVCLSGGTFQNKYLLERADQLLQNAGFQVLLHSRVPANDGGISLGQAVIANELLRQES
jgi:hydrogenase maturation protein HypF